MLYIKNHGWQTLYFTVQIKYVAYNAESLDYYTESIYIRLLDKFPVGTSITRTSVSLIFRKVVVI